MNKKYSIINQRLVDLRKHFLSKIFFIFLSILVLVWLMIFILVSPYYFDNKVTLFLKNTFKFWYYGNYNFILVHSIIYFIAFLLSLLVLIILYFRYNKIYQKHYKEILMSELNLNDFELEKINAFESTKIERIINSYFPFKKYSKDLIASLKKDNQIHFFHLNIFKDKNFKYGGMIVFQRNISSQRFLQINSFNRCIIDEYKDNGVFEFNYFDPKYLIKYNIYSSYAKSTNHICNKEFLSKFIEFQKFIGASLVITVCENIISFIVPGWKFEFSNSLINSIKDDDLENKTETIEKIYQYLKYLDLKIQEEEK